MKPAAVLLLLLLSLTLCAAQKQKMTQRADWDFRNAAERPNTRGCANLTLVLDNWKFAIMTQVKDLLLHDHNTVLPDYGRIQHLSDALRDLYKEFNALKERLAGLTGSFDGVEAFVDEARSGRSPARPRAEAGPPGSLLEKVVAAAPPQRRRSRVVIRRIQKPAASLD